MDFISTPDSSQQEEVEVEVRNWLELPTEITSLIFLKLSTIDILKRAQWVCSAWQKISKEPQLYHTIDTRISWYLWSEGMLREAVDRSCGQLLDLSLRTFDNSDLLQYISEKSTSLRCLRLLYCDHVADQKLIELVKKHTELEELEICHCSFTIPVVGVVGQLYPKLKSFRLNFVYDWGVSVSSAIAENMHELRHLNLFGNDTLMDDHLRTILDGCPHLEFLDLRRCFELVFGGDLKKRTANIKVRFPNDPTHDYDYDCEYEHEKCYTLEGYISDGYFLSEDSDSEMDLQ